MSKREISGHICAIFTILIWGTTFISTKLLLDAFTPMEILVLRFSIGYIALWLVHRKFMACERKHELYFLGAGICGVTLYFMLENFALTYTLASNVGVIISIAPFFTALFELFFLHGKRPNGFFLLGFLLAVGGIYLISFQGSEVNIHPFGDGLAVIAAIVWAMYSTLTKKISGFGYATIPTTRRIFFYGLLCMFPLVMMFDFHFDISKIFNIAYIGNILFLGFAASALCFVTWNQAITILGSLKTSVYIYLVPVITTVASMLVLHETISIPAYIGILLTISGLLLSQYKRKEVLQHEY